MSPRRSGEGHVRMPDAEFEELLARAAQEGARRALADAGTHLELAERQALALADGDLRHTALDETVPWEELHLLRLVYVLEKDGKEDT